MADNVSKNTEKHEEIVKVAEKPEKTKHGEKEIKETSQEFVEGVSEVVEGTAEFVEGEVGEVAREGKKKAPVTGIKGGGAIKTDSRGVPPTIEIMRIQIATQVKNEIRILEKEAAKLMSAGKFNPSKLNGVVAKIRELKDILANLAYATKETLKSWWMKFVKEISI